MRTGCAWARMRSWTTHHHPARRWPAATSSTRRSSTSPGSGSAASPTSGLRADGRALRIRRGGHRLEGPAPAPRAPRDPRRLSPPRPIDWADVHLTASRGHGLRSRCPPPRCGAPCRPRRALRAGRPPTGRIGCGGPRSGRAGPCRRERVERRETRAWAAGSIADAPTRHGGRRSSPRCRVTTPSRRSGTSRRDTAPRCSGGVPTRSRRRAASASSPMPPRHRRRPHDDRLPHGPPGRIGAGDVRARLAAAPPDLEGLTTVFVVDDAGRLRRRAPAQRVARRLRFAPRPAPGLVSTRRSSDVIDAVRRAGRRWPLARHRRDEPTARAVAIDDVLEELLVAAPATAPPGAIGGRMCACGVRRASRLAILRWPCVGPGAARRALRRRPGRHHDLLDPRCRVRLRAALGRWPSRPRALIVFHELGVRLGIVTGKGTDRLVRERYGPCAAACSRSRRS